MKTYKIIRFFFGRENEVIAEGLSLEEAQRHCSDPETSSATCSQELVEKYGTFFDGYKEEE